jgi:hypothetical protein
MSNDTQTKKIDDIYDHLTKGEMQHLVNKIYKHTGLYPAKLKALVEEHMPDPLYPGGTVIEVMFMGDWTPYLIAKMGRSSWGLVNMDTGNRWSEPAEAVSHGLTHSQLDDMVCDPDKPKHFGWRVKTKSKGE